MSFAGTGLHSILGIQHGADHRVPGHETSDLGDFAGVTGGSQVVAGYDRNCDEADCPICNYLAQAKVAADYSAIALCSVSVRDDSVPPQAAVPAADLRPFEARGPPLAV